MLSFRDISPPAVEPISLMQAKTHLRVDFSDDDAYITSLIVAARQQVEALTNRAIFNRRMLLTLDYFPWPGWDSTTGSTAHDYFMHWYYRGLTIRLPKPACVSVESLSYLENDGVTMTTIDPSRYIVDLVSEPARIAPTPGYTWPYQQNFVPGQVKINYTAGTYEKGISEKFTVPAIAPFAYTLAQASGLVTFGGVVDAQGNPVSYQQSQGVLTFDASHAAAQLTANYTVNACPQTIIWAMLLLIRHLYDHREAASAENLKTIPMGVDALLANDVFDTLDW